MQQQHRQPPKQKQLRYRKLNLPNGTTILSFNPTSNLKPNISPSSVSHKMPCSSLNCSTRQSTRKVEAKNLLLEFPFLENSQANCLKNQEYLFDLRMYEEELYRKANFRAVKALLKSYEHNKRKNHQEWMNHVGLDIKKIQHVPALKDNLFQKTVHRMGRSKGRNLSPQTRHLSSRSNKSRRVSEQSEATQIQPLQLSQKYLKIESASSAFLRQKKPPIPKQVPQNYTSSCSTPHSPSYSPPHSPNKLKSLYLPSATQRTTQKYLYEKLAGSQNTAREETNYIYEKRIRSFTDFLFKLQLAHLVYANLDLGYEEFGVRPHRVKCYVGPGNNSAMVKGIVKRRFWWVLTDDIHQANFVWTQIKVKQVFQRQIKAPKSQTKYRSEKQKQKQKQLIKQESWTQRKKSKLSQSQTIHNLKKQQQQSFNYKILNQDDAEMLKKYFYKYQSKKQQTYQYKTQKLPKLQTNISPYPEQPSLSLSIPVYPNSPSTSPTFPTSLPQSFPPPHLPNLPAAATVPPPIHNHLQNNFYLGNKKALFYNLREYYSLIGEDVYQYIPLTFHIRKGFKDPEYRKFLTYFNERSIRVKREEIMEEEGGGVVKTRNIWIVKPGENSNQGRGITVIDQIYQLNNIIKRKPPTNPKHPPSSSSPQKACSQSWTSPPPPSSAPSNNYHHSDQSQTNTHIIQQYIDRPLLYNNRKFDIRHYMLITNFYGIVRAYWYAEGYIRTSSYEFNIGNFQPEIHLTNDAVQKRYAEYGRYEPYNKVSYEEFQRYLDANHASKKYDFKKQILPKMKKMGTDAARSVYTKISPNNLMNNFEIFGLDFMIDRNFRPWLIEINTNPCLDCACPLLDRIIPYMLQQSLKLSIDMSYPPPTHYPNTSKHLAPMVALQSFKYQLIFDSQREGEQLRYLYKKTKGNLIAEIGEIQEDQLFKDDGKEIKLDDFA